MMTGSRVKGTRHNPSQNPSAKIKTGMRRLRISAISYLNTAPLMWDFEHAQAGRDFDISYTLPSACARSLQAGTADIGIIPAAAFTQIPALKILPGVAIASRQPVRSILLISRKPVDQIRTVALDTSSMTSAALTKVIFEKWLGGARTYTPADPDLEKMLAANDAALVIGDPALQINRSRYITLDLAEEWIRHTGKPFVFAFWAVRQAALEVVKGEDVLCEDSRPRLSAPQSDAALPDLATLFQQSRDHGLERANLDYIVHEWSPRLGLTPLAIRRYLTEAIHYTLDPPCLEGLQLFYRYAAEIGALPPAPELTFLPDARVTMLSS
jgi:chorismate dehydratase